MTEKYGQKRLKRYSSKKSDKIPTSCDLAMFFTCVIYCGPLLVKDRLNTQAFVHHKQVAYKGHYRFDVCVNVLHTSQQLLGA